MQMTREDLEDGCVCFNCGQDATMQHPQVNSTMAYLLISFWNMNRGEEWTHVDNIKGFKGKVASNHGGNFAKAAYWELIKPMPNTDEKKRTSGYWKLTEKGKMYVLNKVKIHKRCHFFDMRVYGFSGPPVGITDALHKKFNYQEILLRYGTGYDDSGQSTMF
jgi:hypothetical protein